MDARLMSSPYGRRHLVLGVSLIALVAVVVALFIANGDLPPVTAYQPTLVQPVPTGWYDWADRADRPLLSPQASETFRKAGT